AFTVTNNNTNIITMTGALNGSVAGSTWKNNNGTTLDYGNTTAAAPMLTGVLDVATNTNTVIYSRGGAQNVNGTTYYNLTCSTSGTKSLIGNVIVTNTFNLNTGVTIDPVAQTFTANGNCNIYGTFGGSNTAGISALGDAAGDNIDLSGGTINGRATATLTVNGTIQLLTGSGTIGRFAITVVTPVTITSPYTINFNNNNGVKTFQGLVTINSGGTWTSTSITTTGNLIFQNGITNNGTFSAGIATLNTNNQTLSGSSGFTFSSIITVTGVVATNSGTVTMTGTAAGELTGTGGWTQANTSVLNYAGSTIALAGAVTFNTNSNTVNYSRAGAQTVFDANYYNLQISGSGTKTFTQAVSRAVSGTLNVATGTILNVADGGSSFTLTVSGSSTVAGTLGPTTTTTTISLGDVDLSGGQLGNGITGTINVTGNLTFPTGNAILERSTMTFSNAITVVSPRTLTLNNKTGVKTFDGLVTVNSGGTWNST